MFNLILFFSDIKSLILQIFQKIMNLLLIIKKKT